MIERSRDAQRLAGLLIIHALQQLVFKQILPVNQHIRADVEGNALRLSVDIGKILHNPGQHFLGNFLEFLSVEGIKNIWWEKRQTAHVIAHQIKRIGPCAFQRLWKNLVRHTFQKLDLYPGFTGEFGGNPLERRTGAAFREKYPQLRFTA